VSELIRLVRADDEIRWHEDVAVLRRWLNAEGYDASDHDIQWAYEHYSEDEWCAGWMVLPNRDEPRNTHVARKIVDRLVPLTPPAPEPQPPSALPPVDEV
jgi:hypothetical protein